MAYLSDPVILISAYDVWRVQLAAARLEAEGIPHQVRDDSLVRINWTLAQAVGGAKLLVEREDKMHAAALLGLLDEEGERDEQDKALPEPDLNGSEAGAEEPGTEDPDGEKACRKCGGLDAGEKSGWPILSFLSLFALGVPLLFKRRKSKEP